MLLSIAPMHDDQEQLIGELLASERDLTAVERFAKWHESLPSHAESMYRQLVPLAQPAAGQQYAFEVDLESCFGCKSCVAACHSLNGLDEDEAWRSVGLLQGGSSDEAFLQHVTTACHHCLEPSCMHGCPVNAYEKDAITGVVRHLDDQCIGCRYCTLTCPYGAPKYNRAKGIVRKCDMCSGRLAAGEAPACVQACPNTAIRIILVDQESVALDSEADSFLPGAPGPRSTFPTTRYASARPFPSNALPGDYYRTEPEHPHASLVVMLVLTQLAVGTLLAAVLLQSFDVAGSQPLPKSSLALVSLGSAVLGMTAAVFHLGRPHLAFRAILGLTHSWLSREILAFGAFAVTGSLYALALFDGKLGQSVEFTLGALSAGAGVTAVFCSVMVYVYTKRALWGFATTAFRFLATTALLGASSTLLLQAGIESRRDGAPIVAALAIAIVAAMTCKLLVEASVFAMLWTKGLTPFKRTAQLSLGVLRPITFLRFSSGLFGGILLPLAIWFSPAWSLGLSVVSTAAILIGEAMERTLFFAAVVAPKMPGGTP